MKKNKLNKKLSLDKQTVTNLSKTAESQIKGGCQWGDSTSIDPYCQLTKKLTTGLPTVIVEPER